MIRKHRWQSTGFITLISRDEDLSLVYLDFLSAGEEKQALRRMSHMTSFWAKLITLLICPPLLRDPNGIQDDKLTKTSKVCQLNPSTNHNMGLDGRGMSGIKKFLPEEKNQPKNKEKEALHLFQGGMKKDDTSKEKMKINQTGVVNNNKGLIKRQGISLIRG